MSNGYYIGLGNCGPITISKQSTNAHSLIVGISGSGKSVRLTEIERKIVKDGGTVVAIDLNGTHYDVEGCNHINVLEQGIGIKLMDNNPQEIPSNSTEKRNMISYAADVLSAGQRFGPRQKMALRTAIEFAMDNGYESEMEGIRDGLLYQEKNKHADSVHECLWDILEGDYFKAETELIKENKINIISLRGINPSTQKILVEIFLSMLWKNQRQDGTDSKPLTVTLDEFQTLNFHKGALLAELLTESRKYNLTLILATQTLARYSKEQLALLNQTAVKLFFLPAKSDTATISKMIEHGKEKYWFGVLEKLKVGQAVAIGALETGSDNRSLSRPVITKSEYTQKIDTSNISTENDNTLENCGFE